MSTKLNLIKKTAFNMVDHRGKRFMTVKKDDFDWLIVQAERVKVLQDNILEKQKETVWALQQENQRYREALNEVKETAHVIGCPHCSDIEVIVCKALEVENHPQN